MKKRKLAGSHAEIVPQESFTEILERLHDKSSSSGKTQYFYIWKLNKHDEGVGVEGGEGGAGAWKRPALENLKPKRDALSQS